MSLLVFNVEINDTDLSVFQEIAKRFKWKTKSLDNQDETKMSKEEFYKMIDKASAGKKHKISREEMKKMRHC